jgi:hypothetical protein
MVAKKRSAEFRRRSRAAKLGWKRRRALELKRSKAAKKGAETRKRNQELARKQHKKLTKKGPKITIIRLKYKGDKRPIEHIEVTKRNGKITKIQIGRRIIQTKEDIDALRPLLAAAERVH